MQTAATMDITNKITRLIHVKGRMSQASETITTPANPYVSICANVSALIVADAKSEVISSQPRLRAAEPASNAAILVSSNRMRGTMLCILTLAIAAISNRTSDSPVSSRNA